MKDISRRSSRKQPAQDSVDGEERRKMVHDCMMYNTEKEWGHKVAKLKQERLIALATLSRLKITLAEMDLFIAESELACNSLKCPKKLKLCQSPDEQDTPLTSTTSKTTVSTPNNGSNINFSTSYANMNSPLTEGYVPNTRPDASMSPSTTVNAALISNDKENTTESENSMSITSLSSLKSSSSRYSSDSNQRLTDSIIAEFDKPYKNIDQPESSLGISNKSITSRCMSILNTTPQKRSKVKINPVPNITAHKRPRTQESLTYNSQVLYASPSPCVKPSLHPKDPRYYSKLYLEYKEHVIKQTPTVLEVPNLMKNTTNHIQSRQVFDYASTPSNQVLNNHTFVHPTPKQDGQLQVSLYTPTMYPEYRHVPSIPKLVANGSEHKHSPIPPNRSDNRHIPIYTPNKPEQINLSSLTPQNKPENRHISESTPQKCGGNQHICVPVSPLYSHNINPYIHSAKNVNYSQNIIANVDSSNNKENNRSHN